MINVSVKSFFAFLFLPVACLVQAQDADPFLACADITDRVERVICLEEALENATKEEAGAVEAMPETVVQETEETAVEDFGTQQGVVAEIVEEEDNDEGRSFFRLPRLGNIFGGGDDDSDEEAVQQEPVDAVDTEEDRLESFGRQPRVVVNEDGEDELNDVITELLMAKPNMWLIRLESGQVWRQTHPSRLNLREGDPVRIYPTGWGDNYRLETSRLSGFIQVLRVE